MSGGFEAPLAPRAQDRRDVSGAAAGRLDTLPTYIGKDCWICLVLHGLDGRLPDGHPRLIFEGETSRLHHAESKINAM